MCNSLKVPSRVSLIGCIIVSISTTLLITIFVSDYEIQATQSFGIKILDNSNNFILSVIYLVLID